MLLSCLCKKATVLAQHDLNITELNALTVTMSCQNGNRAEDFAMKLHVQS